MASQPVNFTRVGPDTVAEYVEECLFAGLVPFVRSSPGMGKSSIVKQVAEKLRLKVIDHRMSTSTPEDLTGLPHFVDGKAEFAPFNEIFPTEDMEVPEGYEGWLLFMDEFNAASRAVQAASFKTVLDKEVGQRKLHERVAIVLAGNLDTDKSITNPTSTAMQSRVIHIHLESEFDSWLKNVALPQKYDSRIISYLSWKPTHLNNFQPNHVDETFACSRTWEFMNKLIKGKPINADKTPLYAGTISTGIAVNFVQFTEVYQHLPTISSVLARPLDTPIPVELTAQWAMIGSLPEHVTEDNFDQIATYANRFNLSFRILFFRTMLTQQPKIRTNATFIAAMTELSRYLNN